MVSLKGLKWEHSSRFAAFFLSFASVATVHDFLDSTHGESARGYAWGLMWPASLQKYDKPAKRRNVSSILNVKRSSEGGVEKNFDCKYDYR